MYKSCLSGLADIKHGEGNMIYLKLTLLNEIDGGAYIVFGFERPFHAFYLLE